MVSKKTLNLLLLFLLGGAVLCVCLMLAGGKASVATSTNEYCMSCHYHEQADADWKKSVHYNSPSGVATDCAACHLPPKENGIVRHYAVKTKMGLKDVWAKMTNDKEEIDWESKRQLDHAVGIVYNSSCVKCHVNLYPQGISDEGITAHLHYDENASKSDIQCISCHLDAGHYMPGYQHKSLQGPIDTGGGEIYTSLADVTEFADFVETVPGTNAAIRMVAVPGGEFTLGSPENEPFRGEDEGPRKKVGISPFFMAETEITWRQYWAFYNETMSEGRTPPEKIYANNTRPDLDAVSGPTPPFGFPDQGWGMGDRPAITMTHYAAETFCQWLSLKTGRKYRLPSEAEWEYAAKAGTETPYFFEGSPKKFSAETFWNRLRGADTTMIARYVIYSGNSPSQTQLPDKVQANPFGLKNMLGNVLEYCADRYAPDAYSKIADGTLDPAPCEVGDEYVVRGGNYLDDASRVRSSARRSTDHDAWLKTDPQNPKSIWWYSDIKGIGFRVVCEVPQELQAR